jgi:hypothetical protein
MVERIDIGEAVATGAPNMTISAHSLGASRAWGTSSGPFLPCALHQLPGEKIAP